MKIIDIVLDFFAGSAPTGHALYKQNEADNGNRRFILVQIAENLPVEEDQVKSISDLAKSRLKSVGEEVSGNSSKLDTGFRVFKVDSSNMADIYYTPDAIEQGQLKIFTDNIKPDRTPEDLLFQVLLDWGVDLTLPIRKRIIKVKGEMGKVKGEKKEEISPFTLQTSPFKEFKVYFVDENALLACFDTGVNEEMVKELARFEPLRVVFRDNGFVSDAVKINVEQIFRQMSPHTEVKAI